MLWLGGGWTMCGSTPSTRFGGYVPMMIEWTLLYRMETISAVNVVVAFGRMWKEATTIFRTFRQWSCWRNLECRRSNQNRGVQLHNTHITLSYVGLIAFIRFRIPVQSIDAFLSHGTSMIADVILSAINWAAHELNSIRIVCWAHNFAWVWLNWWRLGCCRCRWCWGRRCRCCCADGRFMSWCGRRFVGLFRCRCRCNRIVEMTFHVLWQLAVAIELGIRIEPQSMRTIRAHTHTTFATEKIFTAFRIGNQCVVRQIFALIFLQISTAHYEEHRHHEQENRCAIKSKNENKNKKTNLTH